MMTPNKFEKMYLDHVGYCESFKGNKCNCLFEKRLADYRLSLKFVSPILKIKEIKNKEIKMETYFVLTESCVGIECEKFSSLEDALAFIHRRVMDDLEDEDYEKDVALDLEKFKIIKGCELEVETKKINVSIGIK